MPPENVGRAWRKAVEELQDKFGLSVSPFYSLSYPLFCSSK